MELHAAWKFLLVWLILNLTQRSLCKCTPRYLMVSHHKTSLPLRFIGIISLLHIFPITTHWDLATLNPSDNIEATSAHLSSIFCKPLTVGLNNNISSAYKIHPRNMDEIQHPTPKSLKPVIKIYENIKNHRRNTAALSYATICCKIRWYTTIPSYSIR